MRFGVGQCGLFLNADLIEHGRHRVLGGHILFIQYVIFRPNLCIAQHPVSLDHRVEFIYVRGFHMIGMIGLRQSSIGRLKVLGVAIRFDLQYAVIINKMLFFGHFKIAPTSSPFCDRYCNSWLLMPRSGVIYKYRAN